MSNFAADLPPSRLSRARSGRLGLVCATLSVGLLIGCRDSSSPAPLPPSSTAPDEASRAPQPSGTNAAASPVTAPPASLPLLRAVPEFVWQRADGGEYGWDELQGHVWLACFVQGAESSWESWAASLASATPHVPPTGKPPVGTSRPNVPASGAGDAVRVVCFRVAPAPPTAPTSDSPRQPADATVAESPLAGVPDGCVILQSSASAYDAMERAILGPDRGAGAPALRVALVDPQGDVRQVWGKETLPDDVALRRSARAVREEAVWTPADVLESTWLAERQAAQEATRPQLRVDCDFRFVDRRHESGIRFRHRAVDDVGRTMVTAHYDHGSGLAVADVDGDGRLDLYFVSQIGPNGLWRNLGDGRFADITEAAGVAVRDRVKAAASFADIDNDGDPDLYVTSIRGGNVLLRNDGTGKFTDISASSGLDYVGHSSSSIWFDYDADGQLDLLLVNVGRYTTDELVTAVNDRITGEDGQTYRYYRAQKDAFAAHLKPERSERSRLYRNRGDGTFADVSESTGFLDESWSGDAVVFDANQDGWPDIYLINMQGHDEFYENDGGQRFVRRSRERFPETPWGSMGVTVLDVDNDGRLDLLVVDMHTDMAMELGPLEEKRKIPRSALLPELLNTDGRHILGNALFRQTESGSFAEVSDAWQAETYWPWGPSAGDFNADGYQDVLITGGMNYPFRYGINSLLLNDAGRTFVDAEFLTGIEPRRGRRTATPWFELDATRRDRDHPLVARRRLAGGTPSRLVVWSAVGSRSSAAVDLDDDGDLDVVTNDLHGPPQVLVNDLAQRRPDLRWLKVRLRGERTNRDGVGAVVRVTTPTRTLTQLQHGKSGYLSQSVQPLYFGLGQDERVTQIEVTWPAGHRSVLADPAWGRLWEIRE
ncbi:MAG: FG-GAP-like repeat-containing protein [Pirellulales bacterium]